MKFFPAAIRKYIKPRLYISLLIERLGFVHRDRWYVNGNEANLIINDPYVDIKSRLGYSNALFNTRSGKIIIGRNVMFGHECQILAGKHADNYSDPLKFKPTIENAIDFDIRIEDGVWLTSRVIVIGGVTVGQNSTVLPGSVVMRDIPPNCVAGGNPAKILFFKTLID